MGNGDREFYGLLEDGGWVPYRIYRRWFGHFEIRKQRLAIAIDKGKINFKIIKEGKPFPRNVLMYLRYYAGYAQYQEYKQRDHKRREIINEYLSFPLKMDIELILDAKSLLSLLKESYPLEEVEPITPLQTEQDHNGSLQKQTTNSGQARQQVDEKSFHIPSGIEWYDIRIHFVDIKNVEITIGKGRKCERNYKSLGFADKKTKEWRQGWMHLLLMAVYRGNPPVKLKGAEKITPKHVSRLGKELKRLFPGIDGNPFESYNMKSGWEPRISLSYSDIIVEQYHR